MGTDGTADGPTPEVAAAGENDNEELDWVMLSAMALKEFGLTPEALLIGLPSVVADALLQRLGELARKTLRAVKSPGDRGGGTPAEQDGPNWRPPGRGKIESFGIQFIPAKPEKPSVNVALFDQGKKG